jgi:subtilisin family serine protease
MRKLFALISCAALFAVFVLPTASVSARIGSKKTDGPRYVPGEMIVQFNPGTSDFAESYALGRAGAAEVMTLRGSDRENGKNGDLVLVRFHPDVPFESVKGAVESDPSVAYAEPNWIYQHDAVSNDPYYTNGSLWGMYGDATSPANQYGSQAGEAWAANHTGSSNVYVGVIDEGAQYTHPDLAGNFWTNPFDPVDGADNDGNGYIDDVRGWDFNSDDNGTYDGGADDHGTHVSGTIGAVGGNARGVAGVNWDVTIITAKFLGGPGGTTANAILAVDYLTDLKTRHGLNLVASNNSWGGGGYSTALHEAIIRAAKANILFVAAAGNSGSNNDTTDSYPSNYNTSVSPTYPRNYTGTVMTPASYDAVIAVMALASNGTIPSWTSYGATKVDLGAPGVGIYSTVPKDRYTSYSGTSMATPHVTGAAALYLSTHAGASASSIKSAILSSTVPTASLSGKCVTGGRLNVSGF